MAGEIKKQSVAEGVAVSAPNDLNIPGVNNLSTYEVAGITITDNDNLRSVVMAGTGTRTVTLPTAADNEHRIITVKKVSGTGSVIVAAEGSDLIDGSATYELKDDDNAVTIQTVNASGSVWNWSKISDHNYEQGTWTPDLKVGGTSQTATTAVGEYVKIGMLVTVSLRYVQSGAAVGTGNLTVEGLPFPVSSAMNLFIPVGTNLVQTPDAFPILGDIPPSGSIMTLKSSRSSTTLNQTILNETRISNSSQFRATFSYLTD